MPARRPLSLAFASLLALASAAGAHPLFAQAPGAAPQGEPPVVSAPRPATLAGFEQAMAIGEHTEAARILDAFLAEDWTRPARLRSDPLRSGLVGRLLAERGAYAEALAYLRHADDPAVPAPQRVAAMLARANAAISFNDRAEAEQALRRADALAASASDRVAAALARARFEAASDPAAALARLQPLTRSPYPRVSFEANMIAAQVNLLRGDIGAALAHRPGLAALAPVFPVSDAAPERLALLDAAIASAQGNAAATADILHRAGPQRIAVALLLVNRLPTCGDSGLRPDDHVTFALFGGRKSFNAPVAASRPEAVAPFLASLAGVALLAQIAGEGGGTIVTLRCRTTPAPAPLAYSPTTGTEWNAARGLFPPMFAAAMGQGSAGTLRPLIDRMEARNAADPMLVPIRLALIETLTANGTAEGSAELLRQHALVWRTVRPIGGAPHVPDEAMQALVDRSNAALQLAEPARTRERIALLTQLYETAPLDYAYLYARQAFRLDGLANPADRAPLEALVARFPAGDPRRRTLLGLLAGVRANAGEMEAAAEAAAAGGLPSNSCALLDEPVRSPAELIRMEDYPARALRSELTGATTVEFDLAADGRAVNPRIIVSAPSLVFDSTVLRRFAEVPHAPPQRGGAPVHCRAAYRTLSWRLD